MARPVVFMKFEVKWIRDEDLNLHKVVKFIDCFTVIS